MAMAAWPVRTVSLASSFAVSLSGKRRGLPQGAFLFTAKRHDALISQYAVRQGALIFYEKHQIVLFYATALCG